MAVPTRNSARTIGRCLASIRIQNYPQQKIEIIVADGGSTDGTFAIAKKYSATVIAVPPEKQNAEYNKSIAVGAAKNEILAMIDHDNILPHADWLARMTRPFLEHRDVVGVETLRYHYDPNTSLIDRYFALFGAGDPIVWYLGKADRLSFMYDRYNLLGTANDCGPYYLVKFRPGAMPTIGANGFLVRREVLVKYAKTAPGVYFDMDVNTDLIAAGFDTYAFVKDSILHLTGYGNAVNYLRRRLLFMSQYRLGGRGPAMKKVRRFEVSGRKDLPRLAATVIICLTVVIPLRDSLRGWRKIRDPAWFLHPLLSFGFVMIYGWAIIRQQMLQYAKKLLGR
ncbi:glycosyltransferase family 2 protein [Patescibacteria group bacterium]|nr:glycosyltransferase family 2 protein [Patescibacteria group bacterium]